MSFQDAEGLVRSFYAQVVDEPVVTLIPADRPALFVRVWRTGGAARSRILDAPVLTTQVWGSEKIETPDLVDIANRLRDALYGRSVLIPPARSAEEVSGLYFDPDPESEVPRYTFASRLMLRAKF